MSTGYGGFTSRDGKPVYADASGSGQRISLCGTDDTDVYFSMGKQEAEDLLVALSLAFEHNGWRWSDPLSPTGESRRNSMLVGALRKALNGKLGWEEYAKQALHNTGAAPFLNRT